MLSVRQCEFSAGRRRKKKYDSSRQIRGAALHAEDKATHAQSAWLRDRDTENILVTHSIYRGGSTYSSLASVTFSVVAASVLRGVG